MPRLNLPSFSRLSKLFFKPQPDLSKLARSFLSLSKSTRLFIKRSKPPRLFKLFFKGPQPVSKTIQTVPLNDLDHLNYLRGLLDCYVNPLKHLNCQNCRLNCRLNLLLNCLNSPNCLDLFLNILVFVLEGLSYPSCFLQGLDYFLKLLELLKKSTKPQKLQKLPKGFKLPKEFRLFSKLFKLFPRLFNRLSNKLREF